jgi:hypothetical protein
MAAPKNSVKDVFEKVGLLTKATECLESARSIYHEHFTDEINSDEKYKHISVELDEIMELLEKERLAFNNKVESLEIFKENAKKGKKDDTITKE